MPQIFCRHTRTIKNYLFTKNQLISSIFGDFKGLLLILKNQRFFEDFAPGVSILKVQRPIFWPKIKIFKKGSMGLLDNHIGYLYIQFELYWSIAPRVYRLLVNTQISSFWAILGNFGSLRGIFSDSRTKNRRKIKIFKIGSIGFLNIIITNHKRQIRSIGSFLVSSIAFERTQY